MIDFDHSEGILMLLSRKIALITGASRGIGQATAILLAQHGATVIGTATTQEGANKITRDFQERGLDGIGEILNVCDEQSRKKLYETVHSRFNALDILVNNAGVTADALMLRMSPEDWLTVIETNLNAVFYITKLFLHDMVKARFGRIVNVSSIVGYTGNPGQVNYSAAKAGLLGLTKTLAQEVATRGITVNAVAPGFIDTQMTQKLNNKQKDFLLNMIPMKKIGEPEDVAQAILFLASPCSGYITGQTLHVNGGMFMG